MDYVLCFLGGMAAAAILFHVPLSAVKSDLQSAVSELKSLIQKVK